MDPEPQALKPERDKTDESLRTERDNSDKVIAERLAKSEVSADEVVGRAREKADAVLDTAREKADVAAPGAEAREARARERALEDQVLESERAAADERLRVGREEQARALAALLPLEREKTDRYLLTERERADAALAHRDDFMGIVTHDLRNLLSGIMLHATLITEDAGATEEGRRTLAGMKQIERYVARMNRLIGDLVDVVSIDAGKLAIQPQPDDAAALITEAVAAFAPGAAEKGIELTFERVDHPLMADFDHDRMLQVLANLLANAIKFTPREGRIVVRGERVGDELVISVRDNGPGIPVALLEVVFQRFWQVGKNDQRGLGLGLYISRCIVDAHGGKIWAESTPGQGSALLFTIPGAVGHAA